MKNKLSALIATLIFTSPLSYAMEQDLTKYIISYVMKEDLRNTNSQDISDTSCSDFGYIDYELWGIISDPVDFDKIEQESKQKQMFDKNKEQIARLDEYDNDADIIDFVDGCNLDIYNYLKRFNMKPMVKCFHDYLGREYKYIALSHIISRSGNLGFCSKLNTPVCESDELKNIFTNVTRTYIKVSKPDSHITFYGAHAILDRTGSLIEKTKFIHFIEDIIVKPLCPENMMPFNHYRMLVKLVQFLWYNKGYKDLIMESWESYLKNEPDPKLSTMLSDFKEKIKDEFLDICMTEKKNNHPNRCNGKK